MQTVLIVIHLMIVLALVGVVLIQRSEGGGLGIGGGSGFMSARGTANALTRTTAILATLFFLTSLGLGVLTRYQGRPSDILDRIPATGGQGNGILDSLGGGAQAPASQPAGNGVPSSGAATPAPQAPAAQAPATGTPATTAPAAPAASEPSATAPATTVPAAPATPAAPAPAQPAGVPTGQ
ncbi:preprotein translocase subunit SecG [Rhizobium leguminosarum bv. trifolii]|uniref:Protein-export membrane protein SecG n=1 Tax=Rhizobium leguminosarum bv. trifolii TaxID=386 RepID=A0A3E1BLJ7_RHILT|nr:preprotein translocase subunit SecG [Rhizobium leguminosarum]RFB94150.1 preprotein translocase subunit SecG [Rhizobium leguminosarum bv. trifolii]RFB94364.1 preprotein translocase subunit SecG [Rhizobium leguminosarum bv. trifolii]